MPSSACRASSASIEKRCFLSLEAAAKGVECRPRHLHLAYRGALPGGQALPGAGLNVIVEKPFASTIAQAKELVETRQGQRPRADGQPELPPPARADRRSRIDRRAEIRAGEPGLDRFPPPRAQPGLSLLGHARSAAGGYVDPPFRPDAHGAGRRAQARVLPHLEPRGQPVLAPSDGRRADRVRKRHRGLLSRLLGRDRQGYALGRRMDHGLLAGRDLVDQPRPFHGQGRTRRRRAAPTRRQGGKAQARSARLCRPARHAEHHRQGDRTGAIPARFSSGKDGRARSGQHHLGQQGRRLGRHRAARKPDWIQASRRPERKSRSTRPRRPTAPQIVREHKALAGHAVVRGSRLPQYRRVLVQEARHHDDHGRDLHPRLRLLQCAHRHAGPARPQRARKGRQRRPEARPRACRHHLGRPRRPGRWRRPALCRRDPRHPRPQRPRPPSKS
jgi:hypothetical protein